MNQVPLNRWLLFCTVSGTGLVWDLYSKWSVFTSLGYPKQASPWVQSFWGGRIEFRLYTTFNEGALWGMGQGYTWLFAILSVAAFFGILYWLFVVGAARSLWLTVSLAFIMSGTLGNLYDRLGLPGCQDPVTHETVRAVRDFLLFTFWGWPWPVFNFADVSLVTGAVMLVLHSLWGDSSVAAGKTDRFEAEDAVSPESRTGASKSAAEPSPESQ